MFRDYAILFVVLGVIGDSRLLCGAEQSPPSEVAVQRLLILRNGQVIEGRITQTPSGYIVDLGNGQMRIGIAEVEFLCSDLEDGYRRKRSILQPGNVHHHLELAQWCLRHELWEHAAAELADASAARPDEPMIAILQYRLQMALEPPPAAKVAGKSTGGPSNDELEKMVRDLPQGTVETFTQSVQPVLMHHCATGGCHGPQSDDGLRLFRVSTSNSVGRRITQRNLYSVLSFVDRDNPLNSRLLTVPNTPHGDAKQAVFGEHQAMQYKRMVDWTVQLAHPTAPVTLNEPETAPPFDDVSLVPMESPPRRLPKDARKAQPLTVKSQNLSSRQPDASDPFDPEVFNRRYSVPCEHPGKPNSPGNIPPVSSRSGLAVPGELP